MEVFIPVDPHSASIICLIRQSSAAAFLLISACLSLHAYSRIVQSHQTAGVVGTTAL